VVLCGLARDAVVVLRNGGFAKASSPDFSSRR
jgi:hypothetical protein